MASCPYLLFIYFYSNNINGFTDQVLHYAYSSDGTHWTTLNNGFPVYNTTANQLRDPYVSKGPDGIYHMVATNGATYGGGPLFLAFNSLDLINWSSESIIDGMGERFFPSPAGVGNLWAPEWQWDEERQEYMVFWAATGNEIMPPVPSQPGDGYYCSANDTDISRVSRFSFFKSYTKDFTFANMSKPELFFDPGCNATGYGGIDGDLYRDPVSGNWLLAYKDARGDDSAVDPEHTIRGVRIATGPTMSGPFTNATISPLVGMIGVEAPEIFQSPDNGPGGWFLYADCSWWPAPPGYVRAPYSVAHTYDLMSGNWTVIPGSCTGNSTETSFPVGNTHGSFLCITEEQLTSLLEAFPI